MRVNEWTRLLNQIPEQNREAFLSQMKVQASVSMFQGRRFNEEAYRHVVLKLEGKK